MFKGSFGLNLGINVYYEGDHSLNFQFSFDYDLLN